MVINTLTLTSLTSNSFPHSLSSYPLAQMLILGIGFRWVFCEYRYTEFFRSWLTELFAKDIFPKLVLDGREQNVISYVWLSLINCPVCSGCWSGYVIFSLYGINWGHFDPLNLFTFWLFSVTCGYCCLICEMVLHPFLMAYEGINHQQTQLEYNNDEDNDGENDREDLDS